MKTICCIVALLFLTSNIAWAKDDGVLKLALKFRGKNKQGAPPEKKEDAKEASISLTENDIFPLKNPGLAGNLPSISFSRGTDDFSVSKDVHWTTSIAVRDSFPWSFTSLYWLMVKTYHTPNPWLNAVDPNAVTRFGRSVEITQDRDFSIGAFIHTVGPSFVYAAKPWTEVTPGLSLNFRF